MTQEQLNEQLFKAVIANNIEAVKKAISDGANVDAINEWGRTPLHAAAQWATRKVVNVLIEAGAPVNTKDEWGRTPLRVAVLWGCPEVANLIKQHGGV